MWFGGSPCQTMQKSKTSPQKKSDPKENAKTWDTSSIQIVQSHCFEFNESEVCFQYERVDVTYNGWDEQHKTFTIVGVCCEEIVDRSRVLGGSSQVHRCGDGKCQESGEKTSSGASVERSTGKNTTIEAQRDGFVLRSRGERCNNVIHCAVVATVVHVGKGAVVAIHEHVPSTLEKIYINVKLRLFFMKYIFYSLHVHTVAWRKVRSLFLVSLRFHH